MTNASSLNLSSLRPVYAGGFAGLQCQSAEALAKAGTRGPITPNGCCGDAVAQQRCRYTFVAIATNISGTDMNFPLLFSPLKIGCYQLKHRRCGRLYRLFRL